MSPFLHVLADTGASFWAGPVPGVDDPPATAPPGLASIAATMIGWLKWGALLSGVVGILFCAIQIMIGRRNRNQYASEGLAGTPWVLGGLALASVAFTIVGAFTI